MPKNVAVVGGSVAGLYASLLLARNGHRVHLFEGSEELAAQPRSLIVTSAFRDVLGELGEPAILNEVERFHLHAGGRDVVVPLRRPDLIIERAALVPPLVEAARAAGVQLVTGARLETIEPGADGVVLHFRGAAGSHQCDAVVGADGARSRVAAAAGWPEPVFVPVVQALVRLDPASCPHTSDVWFVPEDTPYFYWLIAHGDGTGALGVIGDDRRAVRENLDRFTRARGFEVLEYQGARIPEYRGWVPVHRRVGGGDVYLVGDAAGHVKVTTVGGIVNGLWGAEGVCNRIGANGHAPPRTLGSLRVELGIHLLIRRALHHFGEQDYADLLGMLHGSASEELARHSRDETVPLMLRILARRPRFAWLGVKGLCRGALRRGS